MTDLASFESRLLRCCRKLSWMLRLPHKRSSPARSPLRFRSLSSRRSDERPRGCWTGGSFRLGSLCPSRPSAAADLDRLGELRSMAERDGRFRAPFPSPITPAYLRLARLRSGASLDGLDEAEEACRSFQRHVAEMLAEEGKVGDLAGVEELLRLWSSLRSPAFLELVSSFYEQLCNELFADISEDIGNYELLLHDANLENN